VGKRIDTHEIKVWKMTGGELSREEVGCKRPTLKLQAMLRI
jgi:hypothetical protein